MDETKRFLEAKKRKNKNKPYRKTLAVLAVIFMIYAVTEPNEFVWLRFVIESEIAVPCMLGYEYADSVRFNGKDIQVAKDGWYVDKEIYTMRLPSLVKGKNELLVRASVWKICFCSVISVLKRLGHKPKLPNLHLLLHLMLCVNKNCRFTVLILHIKSRLNVRQAI